MAASPRALSRATCTMRAPMPASFSAATCPMPEVAPVITTVFPRMVALAFLREEQCSKQVWKLCGLQTQPPHGSRGLRVNAQTTSFPDHPAAAFRLLKFMIGKHSCQGILIFAWSMAMVALAMGPVHALIQQHSQQSQSRAVKVQMHNVIYRFTDTVSVHIRSLGGDLTPTTGEFPVFEDKNSFTLHLTAAEIAISSKSLADVLNSYVFARR